MMEPMEKMDKTVKTEKMDSTEKVGSKDQKGTGVSKELVDLWVQKVKMDLEAK